MFSKVNLYFWRNLLLIFFFTPHWKGTLLTDCSFPTKWYLWSSVFIGALLIILFACLRICTPIPPVVRFQVLEQIKHGCSHILEFRSLNNRVCLCGVFMPLHSERGTYQYRYGCVYTLIWIFINLSRRGLLEICHFSLVESRRMDFFPISMHFHFHLWQISNSLITYTNFKLKNYCFTFDALVWILTRILTRDKSLKALSKNARVTKLFIFNEFDIFESRNITEFCLKIYIWLANKIYELDIV